MIPLHERGDPGGSERVVAAAVVEVEVGRDQQIDVAGSDAELGEAPYDIILRTGVVEQIPLRRGGRLPDQRGRVAGIDQDGASGGSADQVAGNLVEMHLTGARVT